MPSSSSARAAAVAVAGAVAATAFAAPAHAAAPTWRVVKTYDNGKYDGFNGVLALSKNNAWAFGGGDRKAGDFNRPLAYHWNGKSWRSSALPTGLTGHLWDGSASSSANVWAYGGNSEAGGSRGSYVLRWNGKKWAVAKKFAASRGRISGILALSAKNVWVFGAPGADRGVGTWHYNGRSWTELKNPPALIGEADASSATNAWANARGLNGDAKTIVRFDGKRWKTVSTKGVLPADQHPEDDNAPQVSSFVGEPLVRSAKEVWFPAHTQRYGGTSKPSTTNLLLRWNGKRWQKYAVPTKQSPREVVPDGRGGLWVVAGSPHDRAEIWHRSAAGKWTRANVTVPRGRVGGPADAALMPGTRSVVGAGVLRPADQTSSDSAIFYFKG
ncbi:hypothetical protein [Actinomadura kijaniata]|uniref:hypothetical protein n=1 Tax=Actinomadura kijaniata TaxID=46161 RepID=UPI000832BD17|nr:hypothetical protein [Actinomadura kijaniata]